MNTNVFYIIQGASYTLLCGKTACWKNYNGFNRNSRFHLRFKNKLNPLMRKPIKTWQVWAIKYLSLWDSVYNYFPFGKECLPYFLCSIFIKPARRRSFLFLLLVRYSLDWYRDYLRDKKAFQVALKLDYLSKKLKSMLYELFKCDYSFKLDVVITIIFSWVTTKIISK